MTAPVVVRDRPILMSGPMVRAVLDGSKTMTRRVALHRTFGLATELLQDDPFFWAHFERQPIPGVKHSFPCPYGRPGDRLWIRESWLSWRWNDGVKPADFVRHWGDADSSGYVGYLADGDIIHDAKHGLKMDGRRRPSIHMPRWASRLTLEITEVRVERLQSISPDDAIAEGLTKITKDGGRTWKYGIPDRDGQPGSDDDGWDWHRWRQSPVDAYEVLWDALNAKRGFGWSVNPFVWVITFRKVTS